MSGPAKETILTANNSYIQDFVVFMNWFPNLRQNEEVLKKTWSAAGFRDAI